MSDRLNAWPTLVQADLAPMVDYLNRVVQVAGKYTLDEPLVGSRRTRLGRPRRPADLDGAGPCR
ncbi:hypothetical protein [Streptomyces sp. NPDC004270]